MQVEAEYRVAGRAPQPDGDVRDDGGLGRRRHAHRLRQDPGRAERRRLCHQRLRPGEGRGARRLALRRRGLRLGLAAAVPGVPGRPGGARAEAVGPGGADPPADVQLRPPPGHHPDARRSPPTGRHASGRHPRGGRRDLALRGLQEEVVNWSGLLYRCDNARLSYKLAPLERLHAVRHAGPRCYPGRLCARIRHGRARLCDRRRSGRAAAEELRRGGPERGQAVHEQGAARLLPAGRRAVRLVEAQPGAALDARGPRADRLGHGDRRLGGA